MKLMKAVLAFLATLFIFAGPQQKARAEVNEVKMVIQYSFAFLHLNVLKHQGLIEKQAAALGIPNLKVTWTTLSGDDAINDALLSGAVDFGCGGVPGLMVAWDRTRGTPQEIRGVSAMGHFDLLLNTRNPRINSIKDLTENDRIAMAAVRVSAQALILQMAAAKEWGDQNWEKLDKLTFAMSPPDQTASMLSGGTVENAFGSPPFSLLQLASPQVRTILKSTDLVGDSTSSMLWSSRKFHDANPTVFKAVVAAMKEAQEFIDKDLKKALDYYIEDSKTNMTNEALVAMLKQPGYGFHVAPQGFMIYGEFMSKIGRLKNKPTSWKDIFFEDVHDLKGS